MLPPPGERGQMVMQDTEGVRAIRIPCRHRSKHIIKEIMMPKLASLDDLLVHELQDIYHAEGQILKALPKMIKAATHPELKAAFEDAPPADRGPGAPAGGGVQAPRRAGQGQEV